MPQIAELKEIDGQLWARISFPRQSGDKSVTLWRESEKKAALAAERERCMHAIMELGRQDETSRAYEAD